MHKLDWKLQSEEFGADLWGVNLCCQLNVQDGMFSEKCQNAFHIYGLEEELSEVL